MSNWSSARSRPPATPPERTSISRSSRSIDAEFGPHQVRTFRIPRYPDAPVVEVDLVEWELGEAAG